MKTPAGAGVLILRGFLGLIGIIIAYAVLLYLRQQEVPS